MHHGGRGDRVRDFLTGALIVIATIALIMGLAALAVSVSPKREDRPCSTYADTRVRSIPARCLSYFEDGP